MQLRDKFTAINAETEVKVTFEKVKTGKNAGSYSAKWDNGAEEIEMFFPEEEVKQHIRKRFLHVVEPTAGVPPVFTFEHKNGKTYAATSSSGGYDVTWFDGRGKFQKTWYTAKQVEEFIENGNWKIKYVGNSKDLKPATITEIPQQIKTLEYRPEYRPAVEVKMYPITSATFKDVTIEDIRKFAIETGAIVEICGDFYVVRYDGKELTAQTPDQLDDLFKAVRIMEKASERG
jgi:uncharacterized protein YodC (DUF2158 family)